MQTPFEGIGGTIRIWAGRDLRIAGFSIAALLVHEIATGAEAPVNLRTAGEYAILAKSGISTVPASSVTGNIGVSPIDSTAITGFSLILDGSGLFSTSSQVTGKAYAPDYASPTSVRLTTAVGDMETAYADAAGRTLPNHTELGSGNIGGMTLAPGLYKWGTSVTIPTDVTLSGGAGDVWIFQIAGNLTAASSKAVILNGGARAANIYWQVAGGVGVDLGTGSRFQGIILAKAGINLQTGASINGRLLAQTAVTLDANAVTAPASLSNPVLRSATTVAGSYTDAAGQSVHPETGTITVPQSGAVRFYRLWSDTALNIRSIRVSDGIVTIAY